MTAERNGHVGELLSGYLDGELTQQQRQAVDLHLERCSDCRRDFSDLEELRHRMGTVSLGEAGKDEWRETMDDTAVKLTLGLGWVLLLGAVVIMLGMAVFAFLTDPGTGAWPKILVSAFYLGLAGLFVSVLRQRLIERRTDKYEDVEI